MTGLLNNRTSVLGNYAGSRAQPERVTAGHIPARRLSMSTNRESGITSATVVFRRRRPSQRLAAGNVGSRNAKVRPPGSCAGRCGVVQAGATHPVHIDVLLLRTRVVTVTPRRR